MVVWRNSALCTVNMDHRYGNTKYIVSSAFFLIPPSLYPPSSLFLPPSLSSFHYQYLSPLTPSCPSSLLSSLPPLPHSSLLPLLPPSLSLPSLSLLSSPSSLSLLPSLLPPFSLPPPSPLLSLLPPLPPPPSPLPLPPSIQGHLLIGYVVAFYAHEIHNVGWTIPHCVLTLKLIGKYISYTGRKEFRHFKRCSWGRGYHVL